MSSAEPPLPLDNVAEFSVSELSAVLKRTLEDAYGYVRVRGEISGFKAAASGHLYFALKDDRAVLDAVCWRGTALRLGVKLDDGLEVIASGRITTFPGRSKYQIVIEKLEPAGAGALMALLEERKQRLAAEGLFDDGRKRALPYLPEVVGVVTSPAGAVIQDILHRLAERFPRRVLVWPVLVQGDQAADQVAAAIEGFNRIEPGGPVPRPDLLIIARGGGSLEDLWAFNEEVVVRAAAASAIPLISAIGHETDTSLLDLVADRRAPTPTAAAELAVPVRAELAARTAELAFRQASAVDRQLRDRQHAIKGLARGLPDPANLLGQAGQRLDDLADRLPHCLRGRIDRARGRLAEADARLGSPGRLIADAALRLRTPAIQLGQLFRSAVRERRAELRQTGNRLILDELRRRLPRHRNELSDLAARQDHAFEQRLTAARDRLRNASSLLSSYSHQSVLARGFALVRDETGMLVRSADDAAQCSVLDVEFADGRLRALPVKGSSAPHRRARRAAVSEKDQGRLL